jgi:hypothetical protein
LCWLGGCADAGDGPNADQRQDAALADPFGYGPTAESLQTDERQRQSDISGGGITDFDRDGFKRDLDTVFNP